MTEADTVLEIIKRPGCRLIRLESGDSMTVPLPVVKAAPLKVGQSVIQEAYFKRVLPLEAGLALEQASRMLMMRDRTTQEIRGRLKEVGYTEQTVESVVQKLLDARVLDDSRYLENFISMRVKRMGTRRIRQELMQKGISQPLIDEALEEIDRDALLESAVKHAKKALARKTEDKRHQRNLAYAALARRGYKPDIIKQALDLAQSALQQEADRFPG